MMPFTFILLNGGFGNSIGGFSGGIPVGFGGVGGLGGLNGIGSNALYGNKKRSIKNDQINLMDLLLFLDEAFSKYET